MVRDKIYAIVPPPYKSNKGLLWLNLNLVKHIAVLLVVVRDIRNLNYGGGILVPPMVRQ